MATGGLQEPRTHVKELLKVIDKAHEIILQSYGYPLARLLAPATSHGDLERDFSRRPRD